MALLRYRKSHDNLSSSDVTLSSRIMHEVFIMPSVADVQSQSSSPPCPPPFHPQWRNHAWSIVVNDQVALWTDQVALPSDFIKQLAVPVRRWRPVMRRPVMPTDIIASQET